MVTFLGHVRLLIVPVLAVTVMFIGAPPTAGTHPGANGRLAMACDDGLWTIDADGTDASLVTPAAVQAPAWSPGGSWFAFTRPSPGGVNLWTMNADGSNQVRRTFTPSSDLDPEWSPDAAHVVFASDKGFAGVDGFIIWAFPPGSNGGESAGFQIPASGTHDPTFSADGEILAYVVKRIGEPQAVWLGSMKTFNAGQSVVTPPDGDSDEAPDIAPTSDRYLFVRLHEGVRSIWAADTDGGNLQRLTDATIDVASPRYAPDGTAIAFLGRPAVDAGTSAPYGLWVMQPNGSDQIEVAGSLHCTHLTWQPIPDFPLVDARFSPFELEIEWAFDAGITTGCTLERFCPDPSVRRDQMASFLARALDLPPATQDHFADDEGSIHEADINRIADAGITTGCGDGLYCPRFPVTRAEMASFLARALDLPPATQDHFDDDEDSIHEADINRIADAGITTGCGEDRFCPRQLVRRGEMVAFLYRALTD